MVHSPPASKPRGRRARWGVAASALLMVAGYVSLHELTGPSSAPCSVVSGGRRLTLEQEQAANAATIGAVAVSRDLPRRALTIALATAMQESALRDLPGGDRDSLGLFQQRPSQGWGRPAQIMDPVYAANRFFDGLVRIPGYAGLPLTTAAQQVQHSGYPRAYAKHEADADLLASAFYGQAPGLTCQVTADGTPGDPAAVTRRLAREFGHRAPRPYRPAGAGGAAGAGRAPAGVAAGGPGPADDTVSLPTAAGVPSSGGTTPYGWAMAQWAVAQAPGLRITEVDYRGRRWRATDSAAGWTADRTRSGQAYEDVRIRVQR